MLVDHLGEVLEGAATVVLVVRYNLEKMTGVLHTARVESGLDRMLVCSRFRCAGLRKGPFAGGTKCSSTGDFCGCWST